jgi:hypothetical protein
MSDHLENQIREEDAERRRRQIDAGEIPDPHRHLEQRITVECDNCGDSFRIWKEPTEWRRIYKVPTHCAKCRNG